MPIFRVIRSSVREAAGKVMVALRAVAASGSDEERERLFSDGRGRLLLEDELLEMMPVPFQRGQSASQFIDAISQGSPDRVAAVEAFGVALEEILRRLEGQHGPCIDGVPEDSRGAAVHSDAWTGIAPRTQRLIALRDELSIAKAAVGELIDALAEQGGNRGPELDENSEALDALRDLHRSLGHLLDAIDHGLLSDELGESLGAEIARFGKSALRSLRVDGAKYTLAVTAFALLSAAGAGEWGAFFASLALQVPTNKAG